MEQVQSSPSRALLQAPAPWLRPVLGLLLVGLLTVLVWNRLPFNRGRADVTFARDMAAHHQQAVDMALILRDRVEPQEGELRLFLIDMMLTQQTQIGQMQGWLTVWGAPLAGAEPVMDGMGEEMGMASQEQVNALRHLPQAEAEVLFFQLMIRHHQGGVMMAESILQQSPRSEVARLAQSIVASQQSEIEYMTKLLQERGAEPLPSVAPMQLEHGTH